MLDRLKILGKNQAWSQIRKQEMASTTKKLKVRRKLRKAALGKNRKLLAKKLGTTAPNLPLNKPNANEKAQQSS